AVLHDDRGRHGRHRGHRAHAEGPVPGEAPAGAPSVVSPAGAPLGDLLQALAPPLEYLAADGFRHVEQTRLPLAALAERVQRARPAAGAALGALLDELRGIL